MIFYCLYALAFVSRRVFLAVFGVWIVAILAVVASGIDLPFTARYLLSPLNLCFVLGVAIFQLNRRMTLGATTAVLAALAGLGIVGWQAMTESPNRVAVALGFGLAVWAAASPASTRWKVWRPLVTLGAASYAVYLVHNPALSVLVRLLPSSIGARFAYVLIAAGALTAGIVYWRAYERPMLAKVRQWVAARRAVTGVVERS